MIILLSAGASFGVEFSPKTATIYGTRCSDK